MASFITIGSVTARITSEDAADHVVTVTLDPALGPWLMKAAVPGAKAIVTTPWEDTEVVIAGTVPEERTVTFTIGEPS